MKKIIWTTPEKTYVLDPEDIIRKVAFNLDDEQVFLFPGKTEADIPTLEALIEGVKEGDIEGTFKTAGIEFELAGNSVEVSDTLAYSTLSGFDLLTGWESGQVYEYWHGSNQKELWLNDQIEVTEIDDIHEAPKAIQMIYHYTWDYIVGLMDDDLREHLHSELAPCTQQEFLTAYIEKHAEKFGEEFQVS